MGVLLLTAYIVRREGNVSTCVCPSICLSTGGYPIWPVGVPQPGSAGGIPHLVRGVPQSGPDWGVPQPGVCDPWLGYPPWLGATPARGHTPQGTPHPQPGQDRGYIRQGAPTWGTPWPGQDRGYPSQGYPPWGTPSSLARSGWGYPSQGGNCLWYPLARSGQGGTPARGYPPGTGQHMEYLISGGRYASCIHTGGLSCLFFYSQYSDRGKEIIFSSSRCSSRHLV